MKHGRAMGDDGARIGHTDAHAMLDAFASVGTARFDVTWTTRAGASRHRATRIPRAERLAPVGCMLRLGHLHFEFIRVLLKSHLSLALRAADMPVPFGGTDGPVVKISGRQAAFEVILSRFQSCPHSVLGTAGRAIHPCEGPSPLTDFHFGGGNHVNQHGARYYKEPHNQAEGCRFACYELAKRVHEPYDGGRDQQRKPSANWVRTCVHLAQRWC